METPSKMTTPAADADGTKKAPEELPSGEKKQGMETPNKMTTPAADADGTKKAPEELPSGEKKQGMETPDKMTTPAADADGTKKVPDAMLSLLKELGMEAYYPCKLSLQELRTLDIPPEHANVGPPTKQDLARSILKELMLTNTQCREEDINKFAKLVQPKTRKKTLRKLSSGQNEPKGRTSSVPHPMDVLHVLFMCSDFEVRQILARKMFLCRLAIPFILPYTHQLLLWPLRSIVLEWNDDKEESKDEALVKCKVNMVAFMRFGAKSDSNRFVINSFSKSDLLNNVLSKSGHATFFHRGSPCGGEKRVTSDGMVEMSPFLPAANQHEAMKQPALFFNLRGDAYNHEVPRQVLLQLATVLVLVLDISQLCHTNVQDMLKKTTAIKSESIVLVLTDNDRHSQSEIDNIYELLADYIKDSDIVEAYDVQPNADSLVQEVREAVSKKMIEQPSVSLEEHVTSKLPKSCEVDEKSNQHCSKGNELAESILEVLSEVEYDKMKDKFLLKQGKCLNDLSKALRNLNRTSKKVEDTRIIRKEKQAILKEIDDIKQFQRRAEGPKKFIYQLIDMLHEHSETRKIAVRWVQLRLDELSRQHLSEMHKKRVCWTELMEKSNGDSTSNSQLKAKLQGLEENIASATCGWEHLMRELGQTYEASFSDKSHDFLSLPEIVGRQLLDGHPVELMDGDHGIVPIDWIKAVFHALAKLTENKKILVLSVLGIQSSGKSTLLNTMFGLEFAVSAGRCTSGIYAQLLPVRDSNHRFQYLLVLDSEGLRSQHRERKYQFDNELATLVIGLSDVAMINMKGENIAEMADVLEIVVHAFLRMRLADSPQKRQCLFVHQNVAAVNARKKLAGDLQMLQEKLNDTTKQASGALDLTEAFTSFNRIINFDSQQDVVYFPDLWSGSPPMAAINQEYSRQAGATQRTILQRLTRHFNSFITMEDFVTRTEDMWNGVLSDDFIFSFRNTLAAKAYIDVEKQLARLTLDMKKKVHEWTNSNCEPKIRSCNTVQGLEKDWTQIQDDLSKHINTIMEDTKCELLRCFEEHESSEVIEQWKTEKIMLLDTFGKAVQRQISTSLRNSKDRKLVQLRTNTDVSARQAEIQIKAMELAKELREDQHINPDMIDQRFDELWRSLANDLTSGCTHDEINVSSEFDKILDSHFTSGEKQYLNKQLRLTPLKPHSNVHIQCITDEHIKVKEKTFSFRKSLETISTDAKVSIELAVCSGIGQIHGCPQNARGMEDLTEQPKDEDCIEMALGIANNIMSNIEHKISALSDEKVATNMAMHGEEVLDEVWRAVEEHNKLPYDQAGFALTPQFKAMVAVRASGLVMERFEAMSARYEKQHGVHAQLAEHKQRTFVLFKSAMKQASAEITAAKYICAVLKTQVETLTIESVKTNLGEKIRNAVGTTKRDFIIAILDEIADQEDCDSVEHYVENPSRYAAQWLTSYVEKHLFGCSETNYSKYASKECKKLVGDIISSVEKASPDIQTASIEYEHWLEEFCCHIKSMYISPSQLKIDHISSIQDLAQFQSFLTSRLEKIQGEMLKEFQQTKQEHVSWLGRESGKIFEDWWGCKAHCPFCGEPCQYQNHEGCHKCIQHKPQALKGKQCRSGGLWWYLWWFSKDSLAVDSCDFSVSINAWFHCSSTGCSCNKDEWHAYRDYKKYFPKWDIPPNSSGDRGKYWQWAVATLHRQLEKSHSGKTLKLPDQWKRITPEEAKESLRKW